MKLINQGWECPKCGGVYAPWVAQCTTCSNKNTRSWTTTTIRDPYTFNGEGSKTDEVVFEESGTWCLNKESEE